MNPEVQGFKRQAETVLSVLRQGTVVNPILGIGAPAGSTPALDSIFSLSFSE